MATAGPFMLLWWLAASLSSAVYFYPDVLVAERTDLSKFVRAMHVAPGGNLARWSWRFSSLREDGASIPTLQK